MNKAARLVANWYFMEKHQLEIPFTALVSLARDIRVLTGETKEQEPFNAVADALDAAYVEINNEPLSQSIRCREDLGRRQ